MAYEEYAKALKLGEHAYRSAVSRGEYPYLRLWTSCWSGRMYRRKFLWDWWIFLWTEL